MAKKGGRDESRAAEGEPSKQELQQQMEATRESISETVAEIRDVVSQQYEEVKETYESVKEGVDEALDWREKFSENPVVWGAGAVSVGILIGIGLAQAFEDDDARGGGASQVEGGGRCRVSGRRAVGLRGRRAADHLRQGQRAVRPRPRGLPRRGARTRAAEGRD